MSTWGSPCLPLLKRPCCMPWELHAALTRQLPHPSLPHKSAVVCSWALSCGPTHTHPTTRMRGASPLCVPTMQEALVEGGINPLVARSMTPRQLAGILQQQWNVTPIVTCSNGWGGPGPDRRPGGLPACCVEPGQQRGRCNPAWPPGIPIPGPSNPHHPSSQHWCPPCRRDPKPHPQLQS